jgi:hypothetical protein
MTIRKGPANWVVVPEDRTVHVWLESPPSVAEWFDIEAALRWYVLTADRVELAGPGWSTARAWRMARILEHELRQAGMTVEAKSPALASVEDRSAR